MTKLEEMNNYFAKVVQERLINYPEGSTLRIYDFDKDFSKYSKLIKGALKELGYTVDIKREDIKHQGYVGARGSRVYASTTRTYLLTYQKEITK